MYSTQNVPECPSPRSHGSVGDAEKCRNFAFILGLLYTALLLEQQQMFNSIEFWFESRSENANDICLRAISQSIWLKFIRIKHNRIAFGKAFSLYVCLAQYKWSTYEWHEIQIIYRFTGAPVHGIKCAAAVWNLERSGVACDTWALNATALFKL